MTHYRQVAALLTCLALCGCASMREDVAAAFSSKGEKELEFGIKAYEDGEYPYAARLLQASLDAGLRGISNRTKAHKYLAFIHCASARMQQCRDEFNKALGIDPSFALREDEAGHPNWGPVFRSLKPRK
jgi:Tfp pilus assembly protein PilF